MTYSGFGTNFYFTSEVLLECLRFYLARLWGVEKVTDGVLRTLLKHWCGVAGRPGGMSDTRNCHCPNPSSCRAGRRGAMHCHCADARSLFCMSRSVFVMHVIGYCKKAGFFYVSVPKTVPYMYCCTRFTHTVTHCGARLLCTLECKYFDLTRITSVVTEWCDGSVYTARFGWPWSRSIVVFEAELPETIDHVIRMVHGEVNMGRRDLSRTVKGYHLGSGLVTPRDQGALCWILFPIHGSDQRESELMAASRRRASGEETDSDSTAVRGFASGLRESYGVESPATSSEVSAGEATPLTPPPPKRMEDGRWRCFWHPALCDCGNADGCTCRPSGWQYIDLSPFSITRYLTNKSWKPAGVTSYVHRYFYLDDDKNVHVKE
ncbi:E4.3 protein [Barthadenovirus mellis]|uniref:E4.3 protein n=1 Tax=Passerine adenovirus 1 TaxID=2779174 RepID=A0A7L9DKD3_9ADEN|nr:E4.3 protein [Passerine adenovirus 1]